MKLLQENDEECMRSLFFQKESSRDVRAPLGDYHAGLFTIACHNRPQTAHIYYVQLLDKCLFNVILGFADLCLSAPKPAVDVLLTRLLQKELFGEGVKDKKARRLWQ